MTQPCIGYCVLSLGSGNPTKFQAGHLLQDRTNLTKALAKHIF